MTSNPIEPEIQGHRGQIRAVRELAQNVSGCDLWLTYMSYKFEVDLHCLRVFEYCSLIFLRLALFFELIMEPDSKHGSRDGL